MVISPSLDNLKNEDGRYRVICALEYIGCDFNGWQRQPEGQGYGIQQCVEEALSKVMNDAIKVVCAGRTDAGVHAVGQIIHFDTSVKRELEQIVLGANANLPPSVRIQWAIIDESKCFHARFSALSRSYRYIIYNHGVASALLHKRCWWIATKLNVEAMAKGAQYLLGEHDFTSFRGANCGANTAIRTIEHISIHQKNGYIWMDIKANAFLLHMVRNIIGALADVGLQKKEADWVLSVLEKCDRKAAAITAPADGLYFVHVDFRDSLPPTIKAPQYWGD